ncbi:amino acid synthesis family protein [Pseudonocardia sp. HH130630-07]|uniref:amino acid synthesis family protein n=1 Tax=Pseudonocardia sp. HH130630-07 TaxID=1690815 RepID=UPI000814C215|nr:amino acid synthesis family protein [Pseudonocardia sp. HH130630-07]ANY09459.1 peptide synthetase [Pseudonocardia sp. HH130630-07]
MTGAIRRVVTVVEESLHELGRPVRTPVRRAAAVAVVANPWLGRGVQDDLSREAAALAPEIAHALSDRLLAALGGATGVEAFGKAAIVGLDGEIEHAGALIHTPFFGDVLRHRTGGESIIVFSDQRAGAGTPLTVPLWHKEHAATRSHYQTITVRVPDGPRPGEIAVIAAASDGPRPNARIGDRRTDAALADHVLDRRNGRSARTSDQREPVS